MKPISYSDAARLPQPGTAVPVRISFSGEGRVLTYLYGEPGSLDRRLYALRAGDAEPVAVPLSVAASPGEEFSLEEQLRRERAREVGLGVSSATWATKADALLVPLADGLHVLSGLSSDPSRPLDRRVVETSSEKALAPTISPDGALVAFVRDGEIYVAETAGEKSEPRRLTATAGEAVTNGIAEYVAQEEMERPQAMWWSPDSRQLAYTEVDESDVRPYEIVHLGSDDPGVLETYRYPFAGSANASYRLGVVAVDGGETQWMELTPDDHYLARVHWSEPGGLVAETEDRAQSVLRVVSLDPSSGARRVLHEERGDPYVNLHNDYRPLASGEWLWSTERSGFRHLELRAADGSLVRTLTSGEWQVDEVHAVGEEEGRVYFSGTLDGPTERHLYSVPLGGGEVRRLTIEPGYHLSVVSPQSGSFVDNHSSLSSPPRVSLRSLQNGEELSLLAEGGDGRTAELDLEPPELFSIEGDDGSELYCLLYRPEGTELPAPLVVRVYGGPHVQLVTNSWGPTVAMRDQALRSRGFAVLVVDNRGSARRGLSFESVIHHKMGTPEVADQVAGVRYAVRQQIADPARVAVYGASYGGYMTLRCLELAGDTFSAGVAVAPVTDWDGYDSHYTERYMGDPQSDSEAYAASSVLEAAERLTGELLIVHGLIDENVHFRHTARLVNRLVAAKKRYELCVFPEERHLPRRPEDRAYLEARVITFISRALGAS